MKARAEIAAKVRRAAEDIASKRKEHSCDALYSRECGSLVAKYTALFCSAYKDASRYACWLNVAADRGRIAEQDLRDWRVTALCLLAAMIESGDLDDVIEEAP